MANRITICVDVDLDERQTSKLESLLLETMSSLLDGDVYSKHVLNMDSCIDEVKNEDE